MMASLQDSYILIAFRSNGLPLFGREDRVGAALGIRQSVVEGVGLYSVAVTFVCQREFEIGVRIPLGATPAEVARLVPKQGAVIITVGIIAGIIAALFARGLLKSIVYGTSTRDPIALSAAMGIVCGIGALALALPARRPSRANPAEVLRRGNRDGARIISIGSTALPHPRVAWL